MMPNRVSIPGMMAAVALVALVLGAFRAHPFLGCFLVGTVEIALVRTSREWARVRSGGAPPAAGVSWRIFARSLWLAATLIGVIVIPVQLLVSLWTWNHEQGRDNGVLVVVVMGCWVLLGPFLGFLIPRWLK